MTELESNERENFKIRFFNKSLDLKSSEIATRGQQQTQDRWRGRFHGLFNKIKNLGSFMTKSFFKSEMATRGQETPGQVAGEI